MKSIISFTDIISRTRAHPGNGGRRADGVDGDHKTATLFPKGAGQGKAPLTIDIEVADPFTARSLVLYPAEMQFAAQCELESVRADGTFRSIRQFPLDRSNTNISVGPIPCGPVAVSFPAQTAKHFRLLITGLSGKGGEPPAAARQRSTLSRT